jgi:hypothetical protein
MHPILNGYIAREIIARRQAEGDAWRHSHRRLAEEPEPDSPARRRRGILKRLSSYS